MGVIWIAAPLQGGLSLTCWELKKGGRVREARWMSGVE